MFFRIQPLILRKLCNHSCIHMVFLHYFSIFKATVWPCSDNWMCCGKKSRKWERSRVEEEARGELSKALCSSSSTYSIIYCSKRKFGPWLLYYYVRSFLLLKNYSRELVLPLPVSKLLWRCMPEKLGTSSKVLGDMITSSSFLSLMRKKNYN